MAIGFLSRDFNGIFPNIAPAGCTYYRCYLPMAVTNQTAHLGMPAWDPKRGFGIRESNTSGIFGFQTVVLKLLMDAATVQHIPVAQSLGQRVIVDIDDFHDGLTPANRAYHITDPKLNKQANREHYSKIIAAADAVTVSTPFLLDYYSQKRDNVFMVRNGVNMHQFARRKHRSMKPVLGWAGAVSYRNGDLEQLREWLPDLLEEHDLMFHHAGHDPNAPSFADITGVDTRRVTTSPIVPIHQYAAGLTFDIGIVPLNDIPFNHAKSNIKGLEYAAAGIPFVASDIPEYRKLHEVGVGFIAETPNEWTTQVTTLLDYRTRKQTAAINYNIVKNEWAIECRAKEWAEIFDSLSTQRRAD